MKLFKVIIYSFISIIISISILSVFNYYNIISKDVFNIIKILLLIVIFIINGYKIRRISKNKRCLLYFSFLLSILLIGINLIYSRFNYRVLIYVSIILLSNLLGGFIYKRKKKN